MPGVSDPPNREAAMRIELDLLLRRFWQVEIHQTPPLDGWTPEGAGSPTREVPPISLAQPVPAHHLQE